MASNKQEWIDAFKHLRLHFSLLLMPVYLFALSQTYFYKFPNAHIMFVVLHILIYPASNLYNGFQDNDLGSVGGLKNPPPPNRKMLKLANALDITAILFSLIAHLDFFIFTILYIVVSRLYSNRKVRLKKYPILGFLVIFIFQGAYVYYAVVLGIDSNFCYTEGCGPVVLINTTWVPFPLFAMLATSFQIGAIYPLTQIYQHESDLADGVTTLSYKLGYRGTFIFAGTMFSIATLFYYLHFKETDINSFYLFTVVQIPIIGYFVYWARKVWQDTKYADYKHTMYMNVIAAVVLNLFFLYLVLT